MIKDPALTCSDATLSSALKAAGLSPDARLGVFAKDDYDGMVLYAKGGQVDWHCNGVHCQAGYIYYRRASEIKHVSSSYGQVHGKLYKSLFNEELEDVIGSGFSVRKGEWGWKSFTFNDWLPAGMQSAMMDEKECVFVKEAVLRFANTGQKVSSIADPHELFLLGPDTFLLRSADIASMSGMLGNMLIRMSIHFEVSWKKGNKLRSIHMRKPPHYFVYQLALDIEAHTKIKADSQACLTAVAISEIGLQQTALLSKHTTTAKTQALQLKKHLDAVDRGRLEEGQQVELAVNLLMTAARELGNGDGVAAQQMACCFLLLKNVLETREAAADLGCRAALQELQDGWASVLKKPAEQPQVADKYRKRRRQQQLNFEEEGIMLSAAKLPKRNTFLGNVAGSA
ncbi:hypothetical protein COO60DRAFT_1640083 [Scenedesmus sp. NREL 46B-D3]|nr:hypothetical protein COO60DRAFT_1640083 [Scenedesmus sp. NREL 46B-D3]